MENYEELLDDTYKKIKPIEHNGERFETPKVEGHIEGSKTILTNVPQIISYLRRNQDHFIKYLLKELATSGTFRNSVLILQTKVSSQKINDKIASYVKEFVVCRQCGKPDTELLKQDEFMFIHCLACGAKHSVRSKI